MNLTVKSIGAALLAAGLAATALPVQAAAPAVVLASIVNFDATTCSMSYTARGLLPATTYFLWLSDGTEILGAAQFVTDSRGVARDTDITRISASSANRTVALTTGLSRSGYGPMDHKSTITNRCVAP